MHYTTTYILVSIKSRVHQKLMIRQLKTENKFIEVNSSSVIFYYLRKENENPILMHFTENKLYNNSAFLIILFIRLIDFFKIN